MTFFNTALIGAVMIRLKGRNPTLFDGFRIALSRVSQILAWSLFGGSISFILKVLESNSKGIQKLIASMLGVAWIIASYFIIPVFICEGLFPLTAIARSCEIIKRTWGQVLHTEIKFFKLQIRYLAWGLLIVVLGGAAISGNFWHIFFGAMTYIFIIAVIVSTLANICLAVLYRFATSGAIPPEFTQEQLEGTFH